MITRIQICSEDQKGDGPILYDGEFNEIDFINRDVIMGGCTKYAENCKGMDVIKENLNAASVDNGKKVVIKYWKENRKSKMISR